MKLSISISSISQLCEGDVYTGKMNDVRKEVPLYPIFWSKEYTESVHRECLHIQNIILNEVSDGAWLWPKNLSSL